MVSVMLPSRVTRPSSICPFILTPVSYTHLDVYKRQLLGYLDSETFSLALSSPKRSGTSTALYLPKNFLLKASFSVQDADNLVFRLQVSWQRICNRIPTKSPKVLERMSLMDSFLDERKYLAAPPSGVGWATPTGG